MSDLALLLPSGGFARFACDCLWQSALAGLLAIAVLWGAKLRPATRAWVALLAMSVCIVAPCATWLARAGGLGWLPPSGIAVTEAGEESFRQEDEPAAAMPVQSASAADQDEQVDRGDALLSARRSAPSQREQRSLRSSLLTTSALTSPRWPKSTAWLWSLWACGWGAATLLLAARLVADVAATGRLRRNARTCAAKPILAACQQAARRLGLPSSPPVAYSSLVSCPTVLAWGTPLVLIPQPSDAALAGRRRHDQRKTASDQPEFERWLAVFYHELGHVRRGDGWSGLVVEAITVLLPLQPLLWLLRREFHRACEEACDDWALYGGVDPLDYAAALADWIPHRSQSLALGIRNRRVSIRRRIERLLVAEADLSPQLSGRWIVGGAGLASGLAILLAFLQSGVPRKLAGEEVLANAAAAEAGFHAAGGSQALDRSGGAAPRATPTTLQTVLGDARLKHWSYAQSLGFSPDGETAFSAGRDGVVQLWNPTNGQPRRTFVRPHVAAAASGDGRRLFLAGDDGAIEVADSMTGQVQQTLRLELPQARSYSISLLAASRDGTIAAAGGRYSTVTEPSEHFLAVWDARTEQTLMTIVGRPPEWTPGARVASWQCLTLSADGRLLAAAGLSHISCWNTQTAQPVLELQGDGRIYALAFTPHGQTLASGDAVGNVKLWKITDGSAVLRLEHRATISALTFSPGGERLATVAGDSVALWDARAGTPLWSYQPADHRHRTRPINGDLYFSGDGRKLSVGFANRLTLLDAQTGTELPLVGGAAVADFTALSAAAMGAFLAGDADGRLALWNAGDGRPERAWQGHAAQVDAVAVSPDGATLASKATDGSLTMWDADKAEARHTSRLSLLAGGGPVDDGLAFSADGRTLASLTRQRTLALWDVRTGSLREQLVWSPEVERLPPQAFPAAGRFLLAQWLTGSDTALRPIGKADRRRPGLQLAVSSDGRFAASGVDGSRLEIWNLQTGRMTEIPGAHSGRLQSLVFSPDGAWLASAAEDGQVRFWEPKTGKRLAPLAVGPPGGVVRQVAVSRDGRYLATLNGNGTVSLHRSPIDPPASLAGRH